MQEKSCIAKSGVGFAWYYIGGICVFDWCVFECC